MKKLTALTTMILGMSVATGALAEGSTVQQAIISNKANVQNAANVALGRDATANQGSVQIQGSTVKQAIVSNTANVQNAANVSLGRGATANQGSVQIK